MNLVTINRKNMKNHKLENITQKDVNERKIEVAVIPIGATEPHNYHLPYGTDFFHADYVASESCRIACEKGGDVVKLPVIPYGVDANMLGFPFALNVYQKTLNLFLKDIVDSLALNDVKKIVIINGHGGNEFKPFLRDMMPTELFISYIDWWKVADDEYKNIFEYRDDHSGEMETSVIQYLNSDLVKMEDAADGKFRKSIFDGVNQGWVTIARRWDKLTDSSGVGNPFKSNAEKGKKYLQITIDRISNYLYELSKTEVKGKFPFVD
jgi:creatinine amidohydrolase